jgi:hypothetical protein
VVIYWFSCWVKTEKASGANTTNAKNIAIMATVLIKTFGLILAKQDGFVEGIHPPFFKNWIDKQRQIIIGKVKMIRQIQSMGARSPAILGCDTK